MTEWEQDEVSDGWTKDEGAGPCVKIPAVLPSCSAPPSFVAFADRVPLWRRIAGGYSLLKSLFLPPHHHHFPPPVAPDSLAPNFFSSSLSLCVMRVNLHPLPILKKKKRKTTQVPLAFYVLSLKKHMGLAYIIQQKTSGESLFLCRKEKKRKLLLF